MNGGPTIEVEPKEKFGSFPQGRSPKVPTGRRKASAKTFVLCSLERLV
jgi:hypothetical protein